MSRGPLTANSWRRWLRARTALVAGPVVALAAVAACATTNPHPPANHGRIQVVAAENVWGSLASQLGGGYVEVHSIISNPATDPHEYEPLVADARAVYDAALVVINGVGYDPWAARLVAANPNPHRRVVVVGDLVGVAPGGNPHLWYAPDDVRQLIDRIAIEYEMIDPAHAAFYRGARDRLVSTGLRRYFQLIAQIRAGHAGAPVGASESVAVPLTEALGLSLLTPVSFLNAVSEGVDPRATDKIAIDRQISGGRIKLYVYNRQNATPDVQRQVESARAHGIPVVAITETLSPASVSFQDWQVAQLVAIEAGLTAG